MALTVNQIGDNPQQPGIFAETYIPDQLIAGNLKLVTQPITLASGTLARGSVLGKVTEGAVTVGAGTNTGNGTVGSVARGVNAKLGAYTLTATSATTFTVTDPEGESLPEATVGTAYVNPEITFTITAGATAFATGDSFTLAVGAGSGEYVLSVATATDGSQRPAAILVDYADASAGAVAAGAYVMGEFNGNYLTFDASWTLAALIAAMPPGIFVKTAVSAADPT